MTVVNYTIGTMGLSTDPRRNVPGTLDQSDPYLLVDAIGVRYLSYNLDGTSRGSMALFGEFTFDIRGAINSGLTTGLQIDQGSRFFEVDVTTPGRLALIQGWSGILKSNDTITGSALDDQIMAYGGNDTVNAGNGYDLLAGGLGSDVLNGGEGTDVLSYYDHLVDVQIVLGVDGSGSVTVGSDTDTYTGIEDLEGGAGNDSLTGNNFANSIYGADGNDTIAGKAGDDHLFGNSGNDRLLGGTGDDHLAGGIGNDGLDGGIGGSDWADYSVYYTFEGGVTVDLALQGVRQNTGTQGLDLLKNIENLIGSENNDNLYGDISNNSLDGRSGDDDIFGQDGNDILTGGFGWNTLNGGGGNDTASYAQNAQSVTVNLSIVGIAQQISFFTYDLLESIEGVIGSRYRDTLIGSSGANTLTGNDGNDEIRGLDGSDLIIGGNGSDSLAGGTQSDVFEFSAGQFGADVILDFTITGPESDSVTFKGLFNNMDEFLAAGTDTAAGFKVTLHAGATILFAGVTEAQIVAGSFDFLT